MNARDGELEIPLLNDNVEINIEKTPQELTQASIDIIEAAIYRYQKKFIISMTAISLLLLASFAAVIYCSVEAGGIEGRRKQFLKLPKNSNHFVFTMGNGENCSIHSHTLNGFSEERFFANRCKTYEEKGLLRPDDDRPACIDSLISFCHFIAKEFDNPFTGNTIGIVGSMLSLCILVTMFARTVFQKKTVLKDVERKILIDTSVELEIKLGKFRPSYSYRGEEELTEARNWLALFKEKLYELNKKEILHLLLQGSHSKNGLHHPFKLFSQRDKNGDCRAKIFAEAELNSVFRNGRWPRAKF